MAFPTKKGPVVPKKKGPPMAVKPKGKAPAASMIGKALKEAY